MCDRNDTSLVIDSALSVPVGTEYRIYLFSGDKFYKASALTDDITDRLNFTSGAIRQIDVNENFQTDDKNIIKPPIDTAFYSPNSRGKDDLELHNVSFIYNIAALLL